MTTHRGRALKVGLAAAVALALAPTTAMATAATQASTTRSAAVSWVLEGSPSTNASLEVSERVEVGPGGRSRTAHAFAFASQSGRCDEATDEWVFRSASFTGDVPSRAVAVAPSLASARTRVTLPVTVVEERFADCDVPPSGAGGRVVTTDPVDVVVSVRWRATGPAAEAGPDLVRRPAVASATVSSSTLGTVRLPVTTNASISSASG